VTAIDRVRQLPRPSARTLGLAAALLLAGLAAVLLLRGGGESAGALGYVTEPVDRGPIRVEVTATGTVNPVTTVQVGTYVSGPIREIAVDFNSPVKQGQLVAKIDARPFQVKVQQAEANLANARAKVRKSEADLALKRLNHSRNRELRARDLISQNELDTARSDAEQAEAQVALDEAGVKQAEASLAEARINLGYTDIVSPVDGVVVKRAVDVGQTVAASFQTPTLFEIAQDLTKMQVDAAVSESDIGGVREGHAASFSVDAYPDRRFEGSVAQVRNSPTTVQNVVTYDVVIAVENPDLALKPGMTATVTITTAQRDDVLRVPLRALRFSPEVAAADGAAKAGNAKKPAAKPESAVHLLAEDGGGLRRVPLRTGLRDERFAEVLGGEVAAGDAVVVSAQRAPEAKSTASGSPFLPQMRRR
jgi:HlyD family secretion protein